MYGKSPITALGTPTMETVPPPRTVRIAVSTADSKPTHSMLASAPMPPVWAWMASTGSTWDALIGMPPNSLAVSSRDWTMSTTKMRAGPNRLAHIVAMRPTERAEIKPGDAVAEVAGGQDVADEDGLLVRHSVRDRLHRIVGKRNDDILGLGAAQTAEVRAHAEGR